MATSQKPQACGIVICHHSLLVDRRSWQHTDSGRGFLELAVCSSTTGTAKRRQEHMRVDENQKEMTQTRKIFLEDCFLKALWGHLVTKNYTDTIRARHK